MISYFDKKRGMSDISCSFTVFWPMLSVINTQRVA